MGYYVGLDVSLKATRICVVDETGRAVWEGVADTHPEMIADRLARFSGELVLVGLETGSITPWLYRSLKGLGLPVVCMDARRAADAVKAREREDRQGRRPGTRRDAADGLVRGGPRQE